MKSIPLYYAVIQLHNHIIFNKIHCVDFQIFLLKTRPFKRDTFVHIGILLMYILRDTSITGLD